MRKIAMFTLLALLLPAPAAWAWPICINWTRCEKIPCEAPPDCPAPCEHRICLTIFPPEHVQGLIADLSCPQWCARMRAAGALGCRLHADFCRDPAVLPALIGTLQCDKCWEVRAVAAWSIYQQNAVTREGLLALWISSKLDPHYTVRFRSAQALDMLTVRYRPSSFAWLRTEGPALVTQLRKQKYVPGSDNCRIHLGQACTGCGVASILGEMAPVASQAPLLGAVVPTSALASPPRALQR